MEARCFFEHMGEHCSCLQRLALPPTPHHTASARDSGVLLSLLRCRSLTSITFPMYRSTDNAQVITFWSDEDIRDMAFAWTSLEELNIGMEPGLGVGL
jgi:hypothetical protein